MKPSRILISFVAFLMLSASAVATHEITLYDFGSFNDGAYPLNYGHLARRVRTNTLM